MLRVFDIYVNLSIVTIETSSALNKIFLGDINKMTGIMAKNTLVNPGLFQKHQWIEPEVFVLFILI